MHNSHHIRYLKREEINDDWWNSILQKDHNKLIYAEAEYLDHICPGWSALIDPETETIMPFPLKKKFGIAYALQPMFMQQSGIYGQDVISEHTVLDFIKAASENARLIDLNFNFKNEIAHVPMRTNLIIDLNRPFDDICKEFKRNLNRKIALAADTFPEYTEATIDEVIEHYKKYIFKKTNQTAEVLSSFQSLCKYYHLQDRVICRKLTGHTGQLLSSTLYLKDAKRIYSMILVNTPGGKITGANAYLIYRLIQEFSGIDLLLDFTGSEIPGVKYFFEKFSPVNQPYPRIRINNLTALQKKLISLRNLIR